MLTGDKQETAINIGLASRVLEPNMEIMTLNCDEAALGPLIEREMADKQKRAVPAEASGGRAPPSAPPVRSTRPGSAGMAETDRSRSVSHGAATTPPSDRLWCGRRRSPSSSMGRHFTMPSSRRT